MDNSPTFHIFLLPAGRQNRLSRLRPLIDRLIPREAGLLRKPCHRLNQLIDSRAEQRLAIARLKGLDPIIRTDIPTLHGDLVRRTVNRQAQIVRLTADHQIQGIDRRAKECAVLIPRKGIEIDNRILAIASQEIVQIVACPLVSVSLPILASC